MDTLKALLVAIYLCFIAGLIADLIEQIRHKRKRDIIIDMLLITGLIIVGVLQSIG